MDTSKLGRGEMMAVIGGVILAISLFLNWYHSRSALATIGGHKGVGTYSAWDVHSTTRWLMLAGAIAMGPFAYALFRPPPGLDDGALFVWLLATSLMLRLTNSLFTVPYHALGAELSDDYHERSSISGVRGACGLIGLVAAASLPFILIFPNRVPGQDPRLDPAGYALMGLAFGAAMTLFGLVSTLAGRRSAPTPRLSGQRSSGSELTALFSECVRLLRKGSFRSVFVANSLIFLGTVVSSTLSLYFVTLYVRITDSRAIAATQLAFYAAALVGVPFWIRVSRAFDKRWLYLLPTVATGVLIVTARLRLGEGRPFGTGDVRPRVFGEALAGVFASLFFFIPYSMVADVADEDELLTGQRREGIFFGALSFGQQAAAGLSVLIGGVLIDRYAGLVPGQAQQAALTIERIGQIYSVLPAALFLFAAVAILTYPLSYRRVLSIQAVLVERHAIANAVGQVSARYAVQVPRGPPSSGLPDSTISGVV